MMFDLASRLGNKPIVHIKANHMPQYKASSLETVSPKDFQGTLKNFVAYDGMPVMLLQNLAPQFELLMGLLGSLRVFCIYRLKLKSN